MIRQLSIINRAKSLPHKLSQFNTAWKREFPLPSKVLLGNRLSDFVTWDFGRVSGQPLPSKGFSYLKETGG